MGCCRGLKDSELCGGKSSGRSVSQHHRRRTAHNYLLRIISRVRLFQYGVQRGLYTGSC